MQNITLTADQLKVKQAFTQFILDPAQDKMVIQGYAGTGKTTITGILIEELPNILRTQNLLTPQSVDNYMDVELTATTNKAAEALSYLVGAPVLTIHSFLGLRVHTDYKNRTTRLVSKNKSQEIHNVILFIDEASYIDSDLLDWINNTVKNSKIIFMGDPAQLTPIKYSYAPVFVQGYPTVSLTEVVRQIAGNPIIDLATQFRNTVNTGKFFSFTPDNQHIVHMSRDDFDQALLKDFSNSNWKSNDSKFLAWTNKRVIAYNHAINDLVKGTPNLVAGDYAVCNKYISNRSYSIKTDQLVQVTQVTADTCLGVDGWYVQINDRFKAFLPGSLEDKTKLLRKLNKDGDWDKIRQVNETWIDLRAAYACTINKSQGSTYDRVYIDLDDIKKCNSANNIARMLYVAVSRARHQVFLTGDLV